jgi:hypothetical protein
MQRTPTIAFGVAAVASGLYWVIRRRQQQAVAKATETAAGEVVAAKGADREGGNA